MPTKSTCKVQSINEICNISSISRTKEKKCLGYGQILCYAYMNEKEIIAL